MSLDTPGRHDDERSGDVTVRPAENRAEPIVAPTRIATLWIALLVGIVALIVVLVFILENLRDAEVGFFSAHWRIPLGVDLLFAALLGGLVVFVAGALRIVQLRRTARRHHDALLRAEGDALDGHVPPNNPG